MPDKFQIIDLSHSQIESFRAKANLEDHYRFFDTEVALKSDSSDVLDFFRLMYKHFLLPETKWEHVVHSYYVVSESAMDNRSLLIWDETKICAIPSGPDVYSAADTIIFSSVVSKVRSHFLIHGAAVSEGQNGVMMSGMTGCGKTTLALELTRRGMKFLSDEVIPVSRSDGIVEIFPRALGLRENTLRLFHTLDLSHGQTFAASDDQQKCLINIDDLFENAMSPSCRSKIVLLLETSENENGGLGKNYHTVDMAVKFLDDMLVSKLKKTKGIELVSQHSDDERYIFRFRIDKNQDVQQTLRQICDVHGKSILYLVKAVDRPPDGMLEPKLAPLPRVKAAVELLANLQNTMISESKKKSGTEILFELTGALAEARCYRLLVGNLRKTTDLIQGLLSTDYIDEKYLLKS